MYVMYLVASWLVGLSPVQAVRVRALAGDIALCSWARLYSRSASLHLGMGTGELTCNTWGNPEMD